jgi:hypothetical protein
MAWVLVGIACAMVGAAIALHLIKRMILGL